MRINLHSVIPCSVRRVVAFTAVILALGTIPGVARAVLINFDDIPYLIPGKNDDTTFFAYHPLTDEYLPFGLRIDNGFLTEYHPDATDALSRPNYLQGGEFLRLGFVGALPTSVSMYVSEGNEFGVSIEVHGPSGLLFRELTDGWFGQIISSPPYEPNQFVSFSSASGISAISLSGFANLRTGAQIDDLTYDYTPMPEPQSFVLLGIGLVGLLRQRRASSRPFSTGKLGIGEKRRAALQHQLVSDHAAE